LSAAPVTEPRTRKSSSTREQLIDAAEHLMCEGGLANLTTKTVARECGVAEGTIYRHFASREELVVTTLRERLPGEFQPHIDALVAKAGHGTIEQNLCEFVATIAPIFSIIAPTLGMLAADPSLAARNAEAMHADGSGPGLLVHRIANYFREEQRLGRVSKEVDARAAAGMLVSFCFYRSLMLHLFGEDPTGLNEASLPEALSTVIGRGVLSVAT